MMDTLIELQSAEVNEITDEEEIREKSINFMNNIGNAVSNLLDDDHLSAWEDMPKEDWANKANEAIMLLEEAGFRMAEAAFGDGSNQTGFREIHQTFDNSALQVAAVLPSDATDLPDEVMFPNQTIPVLPSGHWATASGHG